MNVIATGVITAIVMGVSQMIKTLGFKAKFIPAINLLLGIILFACAFALGVSEAPSLGIALFEGMIAGLTAGGLYSGIKNIGQGIGG